MSDNKIVQGGAAPLVSNTHAASPTAPAVSPDCRSLLRTIDWPQNPLGPIDSWSPALRCALDLALPADAQIVIFWGPQFIALYNDAYRPTIGHKHPAAFGRPAQENWTELWDDLKPLLKTVLETGQTISAQNRPFHIERFGYPETVYFDISYSPIGASENGASGVLCIVNETTSRVVAQRKLTENQQRLELLFSQTDAGIALSERTGTLIKVNPRLCALSGHSEETLRAGGLDAVLDPADQEAYQVSLRALFTTGESFLHRFSLVGANGRQTPVSCAASPVRDDTGAITHAVWTIIDITEQVRAQELESQLAAIVSSSHDAILSTDLEMRILSWNHGAERLYGYSAAEAIGRKVTMLLPSDRTTEEVEIIDKISRGLAVAPHETVRLHKNGTRLDVQLTVSPVRDGNGRIIGASKSAHDISDRKKSEQLQRAILGEMKHRIKNVLATVQALARQTFRNPAHKSAYQTFEARLGAMARTHDLLTADVWQATELNKLVEEALLPFGLSNFAIKGPEIDVSSRAAMAFSLGLHELATNASKYGALSVQGGSVHVTWSHDQALQHLNFVWQEKGGPRVLVPKSKGFGSKLIEGVLAGEIGGSVKLSYRSDGLHCQVSTKIANLTQQP
ncbi:PAS domain S-box protein [Ochrobactrum sp. AN78]|uniref:PAS domain-containing sensor histidine kinase n=1 Tax=Ochrobactrum sp. AN78 TaxID=3039853 RepID=UPI002989B493|nr:PAS domain S-box protein [Ochrobactrum sp. AN78]MDH7793689.1 PAS domain S-box-containing protein [Ochrobactrum sp. AN78]